MTTDTDALLATVQQGFYTDTPEEVTASELALDSLAAELNTLARHGDNAVRGRIQEQHRAEAAEARLDKALSALRAHEHTTQTEIALQVGEATCSLCAAIAALEEALP